MFTNKKIDADAKLRMVLCAFLLIVCATAHAANVCPWLTEATAGRLLDGTAVGAFADAVNGQPATCTFIEKESEGTRELTITVEINADARARLDKMMRDCGASGQLLQAIGNEAGMCTMSTHSGWVSERVVGRVRDHIFTIMIQTTLKNDPVLNKPSLMTKMYAASEQVAGNLF